MALMGVGTNTLGYCHPKVDEAVSILLGKGNLSSLNCPEEVLLAEKLLSCILGQKWLNLQVLEAKQMQSALE